MRATWIALTVFTLNVVSADEPTCLHLEGLWSCTDEYDDVTETALGFQETDSVLVDQDRLPLSENSIPLPSTEDLVNRQGRAACDSGVLTLFYSGDDINSSGEVTGQIEWTSRLTLENDQIFVRSEGRLKSGGKDYPFAGDFTCSKIEH